MAVIGQSFKLVFRTKQCYNCSRKEVRFLLQTNKVEKITGLTRRQILYWHQTGLVVATADTKDERKPKLWSFSDLVALRVVRRLREQNVSIQKIRKVLKYARGNWPDLENHLAELAFFVLNNGREVLLLGPDEEFPVSAWRAQGQMVNVLPGKEVEDEVRAAIVEICDEPLTPKEAQESSKAWQDYIEGKDSGESLEQVYKEMLGSRNIRRA